MSRHAALRAVVLAAGMGSASAAAAVECSATTFEATPYTICEVTAGEDLRLWLQNDAGAPLRSIAALQAELGPGRLAFAMNAGMFHADGTPVGLYIENGVEQTPASDGGGYGNFGLLPNGLLCIGDELRVWESAAWAAARPACRYATQSGPMLVIGGALHPRLLPDSPSRLIRNGVGTSADGNRAVFAIADRPVNFHSFARLFRDHLGLSDVLFLDANVSRLYARDLGRDDAGARIGPIVGVVDEGSAAR